MSAASGPGKAPHPEPHRARPPPPPACPARRPPPAPPSPPSRSPRPGAESAREYRRRSAARGQHGSPAPARQAPGSSGVRGTRGGAVVVPFHGAPAPGGADDTLGRNHGASPRLESGALGDEARHGEGEAWGELSCLGADGTPMVRAILGGATCGRRSARDRLDGEHAPPRASAPAPARGRALLGGPRSPIGSNPFGRLRVSHGSTGGW